MSTPNRGHFNASGKPKVRYATEADAQVEVDRINVKQETQPANAYSCRLDDTGVHWHVGKIGFRAKPPPNLEHLEPELGDRAIGYLRSQNWRNRFAAIQRLAREARRLRDMRAIAHARDVPCATGTAGVGEPTTAPRA